MKSKTTLHFTEVKNQRHELREFSRIPQGRFPNSWSFVKFVSPLLFLFLLLTSCSKEKPANPEPKTTNTTSVVSTNQAAVDGPRLLQFPKDEGVHAGFPF